MDRTRLAWLFLLPLASCASTLGLDLHAGPCLNPADTSCADSRLLDFKVYQLKSSVDVSSLDWDKFHIEGADREQLGAVLTDPQHPDCVRKITIDRGEQKSLPTIQRLPGTQYLLVVTLGRNKGPSSLRVVPLGRFQKREDLCFSYYDVFAGPRCEHYLEGQRQ